MIKRRSVLTWFSFGWLVSFFPVVISSCSPEPSDTTSTDQAPNSPSSNEPIAVGKVADLEQNGQLQTKAGEENILVIPNPANLNQAIAVTSTCTHRGCTVEWKADAKQFACPCHGAEFASDGKVIKGPATTSLKTYATKIEGDTVLVQLA